MGDITSNGDSNEQPVYEVLVKSFHMGRYPVTFTEYDYFCEETRHALSLHENREKPDDEGWGRDNRPVIMVTWYDAVAYTEWLSKQTGQQYSLPTEAEWEYAARAGTETYYWWSNDIDETKANYDSTSTTPVGDYKPNPFGLYDTSGNVWEWTYSEYENQYKGKEKEYIGKINIKTNCCIVNIGTASRGVFVLPTAAGIPRATATTTTASVLFWRLRGHSTWAFCPCALCPKKKTAKRSIFFCTLNSLIIYILYK